MKSKLLLSVILGVITLAVSIYVAIMSLMYGEPLTNLNTIYNYSLIISLFLLFVSTVMLTHSYGDKVDWIKSILYPFAVLSVLYFFFYPTVLLYKLLALSLGIVLFQTGFSRAKLLRFSCPRFLSLYIFYLLLFYYLFYPRINRFRNSYIICYYDEQRTTQIMESTDGAWNTAFALRRSDLTLLC